MEIYADPITVNCRKVIAGLKLMGVSYELKKVDYFKAEQKSDAYVVVNPNASLPAMRDAGLTLWESNAILCYAADKYGKNQYYPTDLAKRADVNRWLFWECGTWFPSAYIFLVENCVKPLLGGAADSAIIDKELANFHKLAGILDAQLAKTAYLCGDSVTLADIAVASPIHLHGWQKLPLQMHPNLRRWLVERIEPLPCWRDSMVYEGFTLQNNAA